MNQAWDWAAGPALEHRLNSLLYLAEHRGDMPGAVFFTVPDGAEEDEQWQTLIRASKPQCNCKSRRLLWPARGRSRLLLRKPPQEVVMEYQERSGPGTGRFNAKPLVIGPHGGDLHSAYALWSFDYNDLVGHQLPFMQDRRPLERLLDNQAGLTMVGQDEYSFRRGMDDVEHWLRVHGEVTFMHAQVERRRRRLWLPMCSLTRMNMKRGDPDPSVTFQIDATVRVLPYEDVPAHVCVDDVDTED